MIRFGPAGIPLSCKGRTLRDGITDIHNVGLSAMELQFIKVNPLVREPLEEELGRRPREIPGTLIVEVGPPPKGSELSDPRMLNEPLSRRSRVTVLTWFLAKDHGDLTQGRLLSQSLDVRLTLHAPNYVDLVSSPAARERTLHQYQWAATLAAGLGSRAVVGHLGFYGAGTREETYQRLVADVRLLRQWMEGLGREDLLFLVEPSGHPEIFGTREEVLRLSREVKGVRPVLHLAHLAARERTRFEDRAELQALVEEFVGASHGELYLNFSGVEFHNPGDFRFTPIKRGMVHFDAVAELLADRDYDATVISSSPLLEHDAMYMKLLYERALAKRFAKRHAPPAPPAAARPQAPPTGSGPRPKAPPPRRPSSRPPAKRPPAPSRTKPPPARKGRARPPRPAKKTKPKPRSRGHGRSH
jgi:deoxyribonuclease-4